MWKSLLTAGALALATALPAAAATLNVDANGILTGASGVTVGTNIYNVEFLDGSCVSLFSNCAADPATSSLPPFAFTTLADAIAAGDALLLQVFVDGAQGNFDTVPGSTRGCAPGVTRCFQAIPFELRDPFEFVEIVFGGSLNDSGDMDRTDFSFFTANIADFTNFDDFVYARWTEVTLIPLPAGAPLVLSGLAAFGALQWRKRRERRRAQV
jgi:hypothetical protein